MDENRCKRATRQQTKASKQENTEETIVPKIQTENSEVKTLGPYNLKEKIIIVYDCANDEMATDFVYNNKTITVEEILKDSIVSFMQTKNLMNKTHEYALVVLGKNNFIWLVDFTSDYKVITKKLYEVTSCEPEDKIVLDKLFEMIQQKLNIKTDLNINEIPEYIVRVVFTYVRSYTIPELSDDYDSLLKCPAFFFDFLYAHEIPTDTNHCDKIFKVLQSLDKKGLSYMFSVTKESAPNFKFSLMKLLAHPLQRPRQHLADYTLK